VGYYAAGYTMVTFFLNLGIAYNLSLLPSLTRLRNTAGELETLFHTATAQVFAVGLPLAVGGSLLAAPIVRLLFGPGYAASAAPFAILIWAIPLNLLRDVPLMALLSAEGERWVFRVTLASAGLNLVLNVALIPAFGLIGAASATVLTEAVRMLLAAWVARGLGFHLPGPRRFVKAGLATVAMAGCLVLLPNAPVWLSVAAGGVAYLLVLAGLGGIRLGEGRQPILSV
jgi:O-antigen/teichoic acid export membrane protein